MKSLVVGPRIERRTQDDRGETGKSGVEVGETKKTETNVGRPRRER